MGLWEVQEKFDSRLPVNKPILFITKDQIDFSDGSPRTLDLLVANEDLKTTDILDPIFLTAHYWTKERYPAEEVTSDRFGRIRSQNMGYLLQLAMIYLKKEQ